jgi:hypothetical protein
MHRGTANYQPFGGGMMGRGRFDYGQSGQGLMQPVPSTPGTTTPSNPGQTNNG